MAIIGKIQEKGRYLLVGFVGLALLTFILSGLFKAGGTPSSGNIGTIDGEMMDQAAYAAKADLFVQNDARQAQQQQRQLTEKDIEATRDRAWQAVVDETLLNKEMDVLGLEVTDKEFDAYLYGEDGFTLMPDIQQAFTDSVTGKFNPKALDRFIEERESSKDAEQIKQWDETKKSIREQRRMEKYFQLMRQGVYVTKLEAKADYIAKSEQKSVSFVMKSFRDIDDKTVTVTDADIEKFYEAHKEEKKYEQRAGREVRYFDVQLQPSGADTNAFKRNLDSLKVLFAASKDDSVFVMNNTDGMKYAKKGGLPYRKEGDPNAKQGTYPAMMDTVFRTASVGSVVGPYEYQGKTFLAKIEGFNEQSLSARHILIPVQRTAPAADIAKQKKMADSLAAELNKDKSKFDAFVTAYSTDDASKANGGKYDDFYKDEFVPEFSNFVIVNPIGKIGVVQTNYGFHIIEVLGKKDARIPLLSIVEKTLAPSEETASNLKEKAYEMLDMIDAKISGKKDLKMKLELFDTIARKEGFFARPVQIDERVPRVNGFNSHTAEQKILELAFAPDAEPGQLCSSPINDDGRYIIAIVASIHEDGVPALTDIYMLMKQGAMNEKKAAKIQKQIGSQRNLDRLAAILKTDVKNADLTFASASIQNAGYEPRIVGSIFSGLAEGATTVPLVGDNGVYVFRLIKTTKAPVAANYENERKQLVQQQRASQQNTILSALRKKGNAYDNRALTELGIFR